MIHSDREWRVFESDMQEVMEILYRNDAWVECQAFRIIEPDWYQDVYILNDAFEGGRSEWAICTIDPIIDRVLQWESFTSVLDPSNRDRFEELVSRVGKTMRPYKTNVKPAQIQTTEKHGNCQFCR